jgi:hypothetical protein
MRGHRTRRLSPSRGSTHTESKQSRSRSNCLHGQPKSAVIAVMESPRQTSTPAITGEFATRIVSMEHLTSTPRQARCRNPYVPGSKRFPRVRTKGTTARVGNARNAVQSHFRESPRSDSRERETKIAPPSKRRSSMMSMKNPESARCPNPPARGASRPGPRQRFSGTDSLGIWDLNKASGRH